MRPPPISKTIGAKSTSIKKFSAESIGIIHRKSVNGDLWMVNGLKSLSVVLVSVPVQKVFYS